jgi:hypothetical protein
MLRWPGSPLESLGATRTPLLVLPDLKNMDSSLGGGNAQEMMARFKRSRPFSFSASQIQRQKQATGAIPVGARKGKWQRFSSRRPFPYDHRGEHGKRTGSLLNNWNEPPIDLYTRIFLYFYEVRNPYIRDRRSSLRRRYSGPPLP